MLCSACHNHLIVVATKLKTFGSHGLHCAAPTVWNSLLPNVSNFKIFSGTENWLFSCAYITYTVMLVCYANTQYNTPSLFPRVVPTRMAVTRVIPPRVLTVCLCMATILYVLILHLRADCQPWSRAMHSDPEST